MPSVASALRLERFHALGFFVGLVVEAEQMQHAVHDEVGDMIGEREIAFASLRRGTVS